MGEVWCARDPRLGRDVALSSSGEMALALEPRFLYRDLHPGVLAVAPLAGGAARRLLPQVNAGK
jgi:hypothetical protein